MTRTPPLLPEQALMRVLRISRVNGSSMTMIAGFFALVSALAGDAVGAMTGLVVAGAGAIEVHGNSLLTHGHSRGTRWLIGGEFVAWLGLMVYCAVRFVRPEIPPVPDELKPLIALDAQQVGLSPEDFLLKSYQLLFILLAAGTTAYQGGMMLYYLHRRPAVVQALRDSAIG